MSDLYEELDRLYENTWNRDRGRFLRVLDTLTHESLDVPPKERARYVALRWLRDQKHYKDTQVMAELTESIRRAELLDADQDFSTRPEGADQ